MAASVMMVVAGTVVAATILLLAILVVVVLRARDQRGRPGVKESFDDAPTTTNNMFTAKGAAYVDDACQTVSADGSPYVMHGMPYLKKHPANLNQCLFIPSDPAIMDPNTLDSCTSDWLADSDGQVDGQVGGQVVVSDVSVQDVLGAKSCVVTVNPGQTSDAYAQYETTARSNAVKRTKLYVALQKHVDELPGMIQAMQNQVTQQQAALDAATQLQARLRSDKAQRQQDVSSMQMTVDSTQSELQNTQDQDNRTRTQADGLESTAAAQESQVNAQQSQVDSLNNALNQANAARDANHAAYDNNGRQQQDANNALSSAQRDLQNIKDQIAQLGG